MARAASLTSFLNSRLIGRQDSVSNYAQSPYYWDAWPRHRVGLTFNGGVGHETSRCLSITARHRSLHAASFRPGKMHSGLCVEGGHSRRPRVRPPQTRQQAWNDNAQQDARRAGGGPYGYETCKQGYVWREATTSDKVCVTPATRDQARYDNSQAGGACSRSALIDRQSSSKCDPKRVLRGDPSSKAASQTARAEARTGPRRMPRGPTLCYYSV